MNMCKTASAIKCRTIGFRLFLLLSLMLLISTLTTNKALAQTTIDQSELVSVDTSTNVNFSGIFTNRRTRTSTFNTSITNTSTTPIPVPLILVIDSISEPTVTVANADGTTTPDGKPFFDFTGQVPGTELNPGESTSTRPLVFNNPSIRPFTIQTSVFRQQVSPPPTNVTLLLSTDDNQSVIMKNEPVFFSGVPQGVGEELTVIVNGTIDATQVQLTQVNQAAGSGKIFFGMTGANTSTTLTTSGGTPNQAVEVVRFAEKSTNKGDIKIQAFVNSDLAGEKFATAILGAVNPRCVHLSDQRPVKAILTVNPPIEGVKFDVQNFLGSQNIVNPSNMGDGFTQVITGANGTDDLEFSSRGFDAYTLGRFTPQRSDSYMTESPGASCDKKTPTKRDPKGDPYTDPGPGTQFPQNCPDPSKDDSGNTSVDLADGEKKIVHYDLTIPGRGFDYEFYCVYRSFNYRKGFDRKDFGENWTYSYADEFLVKDGSGADNDANYINFRDGQTGYAFVRIAPGVWAPALQEFVQLSINDNTGDFEIRDQSGMIRVYNKFSDTNLPNINGRLKAIIDRNDNILKCNYELIDPDNTITGDEKFVLAFVIDTLGRDIRYQYYAKTKQTVNGRVLTIVNTNPGALGRLARVKDFKGDMDFDGSPDSEDFPGQINNRTLFFDYDSEGNLVRCSGPAVANTPNGNDFPNGKTYRYQYITTADLPGGLTPDEQDRLLHKLTRIWYPNEVGNNPNANPPDDKARETIKYIEDSTDPFFGFANSYTVGGTNATKVTAGGTIMYKYTDLNPTRSMPVGVNLDPTILINLESLKAEVTDRNGNQAEYTYGGEKKMLKYTEFTRGLRSKEPTEFTMTFDYNKDRLLTQRTFPEDNSTNNTYNDQSTDRFQQSNRIRSIRIPDTDRAPNDQNKIEKVVVYEPIYNRPCLVIYGRGSDIANNDFTPPVQDPVSRLMTDPYDSQKTVDLRYARAEFFDYQEPTEKASSAPDTRLDIDGSGGKVNESPLIAIDPPVLTIEVLLIQELGLSEDADGLAELRKRLSANLVKLALGDLNNDGIEGVRDTNGQVIPTIAGNIVRTIFGSPVLIAGSNQHALEKVIDPIDVIDETLDYIDGGPMENGQGARLQTIVTMYRHNQFGQVTDMISPEGNITTNIYFPEIDPDGDGILTPPPAHSRVLNTFTGGYLETLIRDIDHLPGANNNTPTPPTAIRMDYTYDDVGNATSITDGRRIVTDYFVNELNQVVQTIKASSVPGPGTGDPPEPVPLVAFRYIENTFYDFNDNIDRREVEDRGDTSNTDGFVDYTYKFDILDNQIEMTEEIAVDKQPLITLYRYDPNENRVMTIHPASNADSAIYDERDLLFQSTRGANTRPVAGLFGPNDPNSFDRRGGEGTVPSTMVYSYDKNQNLVETVDAEDNGGTKSKSKPFLPDPAVMGDATIILYDGYDRRKIVTDPVGNVTRYFYDPDDNVVRTISDGDPINDVPGNEGNKTLSVSEFVHDTLSRVFVTHQALFQTPDAKPVRTPTLTDTPAMDTLAAYLFDAPSDTSPVPGSTGIIVIGRVTTLTEYDSESRVTFTVQDDLDAYRTDYDGVDRVVKTTDSALSNGFSGGKFDPSAISGNIVQTAYDDNNNPIERLETDVTDVPGVPDEFFCTTYLYDSLDRLQTMVDPIGQTEEYRYDSRNNLVAKADAVGLVSGRNIPRRGLCADDQTEHPRNTFGNVTRTFYDGINRTLKTEALLTASGEGNGSYIGATIFGVKIDPPVNFLDPMQSEDGIIKVHYAWDGNTQLIALRDDDGNTTCYINDNQNRTLVERKGQNISFQGIAFNIAGGDSGMFNEARMPPDPLKDPPEDTEPAGTDITFFYDRDNNVVKLVDEATNNFDCAFDALNRKKDCDITRAGGFIGTTLQEWQYDGLSRMTFCLDNNQPALATDDVLCEYFYDSLSRKVEETQKIGQLAKKAISCNFDVEKAGVVNQCSATIYPDDRQVDNLYDTLDRLISRTDKGQTSAIGTYDYIGKWRVANLTYQNKTRLTHLNGTTDVGFDDLRRIINHRWESFITQTPGNATLIVGFEHQDASGNPGYDRANNKRIEFKTHDPNNSEQYKYDSVYRLTSTGSDSQPPNTRGFERGMFADGKLFPSEF